MIPVPSDDPYTFDFDSFIELECFLMDLRPDDIDELASDLAASEFAASKIGLERIARVIHLAITYRPAYIDSYIALLKHKKLAEKYDKLRLFLLHIIFHFFHTSFAYPSECGSLAYMYRAHKVGVYSDAEILDSIIAFFGKPKIMYLQRLWIFAYFAPLIVKFDPSIEHSLLDVYRSKRELLAHNRVEFTKFYDEIDNMRKNNWELHGRFVEQRGTIASILAHDDIEGLQKMSSFPGFDFDHKIKPSLFEPCWFLRDSPTLLQYAVFHNATKCVEYLQTVANVELMDNKSKTLAQFAVAGGSIEMLTKVKQFKCSFGDTLQVATGYFRSDIFFWLHETEFSDLGDDSGNYGTTILSAASSGNMYLLKFCLEQGIDVNSVNTTNTAALHFACYIGQIEMVVFLLSRDGINVNLATNDLITPIMLAAQHGHSITARLLIARPELEINTKNVEDYTALELACINGHSNTVKELLKHPKIDLNLPVNGDRTPIYTALLVNDMKTLQMLVDDERTNVNWKNIDGDTPLHYALELANLKGLEILLSCKRIRVNEQDAWLNTPLHKAAILGNKEAVAMILAHPRVNLFVTNEDKETPYEAAKNYSTTEIIDMIEDLMPYDALE